MWLPFSIEGETAMAEARPASATATVDAFKRGNYTTKAIRSNAPKTLFIVTQRMKEHTQFSSFSMATTSTPAAIITSLSIFLLMDVLSSLLGYLSLLALPLFLFFLVSVLIFVFTRDVIAGFIWKVNLI